MSLKSFHIVFVLAAIGTAGFFGHWCSGRGAEVMPGAHAWMGALSYAVAASLAGYLILFIAKVSKASSK